MRLIIVNSIARGKKTTLGTKKQFLKSSELFVDPLIFHPTTGLASYANISDRKNDGIFNDWLKTSGFKSSKKIRITVALN